MYVVYVVIAALSLAMSLGMWTRASAALLCALFTYAHFIDLTNYLNHYWLVTLLTALLAILPGTDAAPSFDSSARRTSARTTASAWAVYLFRFQIAVVYFFAGAAKLKYDWLVLAQPMRTWLLANTDVPILGPLFRYTWVAYLMSWGGAIYDLTIVAWLCHGRRISSAHGATVQHRNVSILHDRSFPSFPRWLMAAKNAQTAKGNGRSSSGFA
jgi:vitamin K-dependent gamma-carboxylase